MDVKPSGDVQSNQQQTNSEPTVSPTGASDGGSLKGGAAAPETKKKSKFLSGKKLVLVVVAAVALLGTGSAAAYIGLVQNNPDNVWKKSLQRTSDGFKNLVEQNKTTPMKNAKFDGNFKLEGPMAADGTLSGSSSEKNAQIKMDVGVSGIRANADLRMITADGAKNPDVYMNISGLKSIAALAGSDYASLINEVDGKWYMIDHTLLDQVDQESQAGASGIELSPEDATVILEKVQAVMAERVFTVDKTKAIFVVKENVGKEDFEGMKTYKYKVGLQKQQMKDFATAMKDALKETKVKDLVLSTASGKTFEEAIDFENMLKSFDDINESDTAEVWASIDGKFIRNVRFTDSNNSKNTLDIGLEKLGDTLPMYLKLAGDDESGSGFMKFTLDYNQKTLAAKVGFVIDGTFDKQAVKFNMSLNIEPTAAEVKVEKPSGATNAMELFGSLFGGMMGGGTGLGDTQLQGSDSSLIQRCAQAYEDWANSGGTATIPEECSQLDSL